jgi:hypothetical protein
MRPDHSRASEPGPAPAHCPSVIAVLSQHAKAGLLGLDEQPLLSAWRYNHKHACVAQCRTDCLSYDWRNDDQGPLTVIAHSQKMGRRHP